MLLNAPRFSKYLHGAAMLYAEGVSKTPYWFVQTMDGSMVPASWEEMSDDRDEFYEEVSLTAEPASELPCLKTAVQSNCSQVEICNS